MSSINDFIDASSSHTNSCTRAGAITAIGNETGALAAAASVGGVIAGVVFISRICVGGSSNGMFEAGEGSLVDPEESEEVFFDAVASAVVSTTDDAFGVGVGVDGVDDVEGPMIASLLSSILTCNVSNTMD